MVRRLVCLAFNTVSAIEAIFRVTLQFFTVKTNGLLVNINDRSGDMSANIFYLLLTCTTAGFGSHLYKMYIIINIL